MNANEATGLDAVFGPKCGKCRRATGELDNLYEYCQYCSRYYPDRYEEEDRTNDA